MQTVGILLIAATAVVVKVAILKLVFDTIRKGKHS